MSSAAAAIPTAMAVEQSFQQLEKQRELINSCTQLWKELSDHFSTIEKGLQIKSESLRSKRQSLDASTRRSLDSLQRREHTIDGAVDFAVSKVEEVRAAALKALAAVSAAGVTGDGEEGADLVKRVRFFCAKMDSDGFLDLVMAKRKEVEILRAEMPGALVDCIDPAKFVLDAISKVFPVDKRVVKSPSELGWACVLILEALVPALADPELGIARPLVTRTAKDRAAVMAKEWKDRVEQQGGIESVKPPDAHAFLQHVVTFGIVCKEDKELYKSIVISFAWRKQMPKLAISLGLEDEMEGIIEELIRKGHQLDAINFAYEAGLQEKFPAIPLVKSFLKDSKKATASTVDDTSNPCQAASNNNRKEQSVIRAAMKCIQDHNLEADFPLENLQKRLEQLEKVKQEKKRPSVSGPATKRTRASNGGPMPPAKAGRLTNNAYVSSFPAAPAFVRSPSAHTDYPAAAPYVYDRPVGHGVYGSRSPPAVREPYAYPPPDVAAAAIGAPYHSPPMSYPAYGSYNNGLGGYNNGMAPGYQQAYYR